MKHTTSKIGQLGESIATKFLTSKSFSIIERNYRKKWGEIDVIAEKDGILHFVEVKTVSRKKEDFGDTSQYSPEENVHPQKIKRLYRTIETYLLEKKRTAGKWQFDVIGIFLDVENKKAVVRFTENVIV